MLVKVKGRKLDCSWLQLGVEGDNAVELVQFEIPRFTSASVDLSEGITYILFELADGTSGIVSVLGKHKTITEESLKIDWHVGHEVTAQPGRLSIALKISGLSDELWHSEIAQCTVAKTIQAESPQPIMYRSRMAAVDSPALFMENPDTEPPITVTERTLNIPSQLQNIAVQNDQNSETVKIVCPRYFDGHDLSRYSFYLRTQNSNEQYDPVSLMPTVGETELTMLWTLRPPQTSFAGTLSIQLWVTGESFDWQTASANLNIITQLAGEPIIPLVPSVLDELLKQMLASRDAAKLSETNAQLSADAAEQSAIAAQAAVDSIGTSVEDAAQSALEAQASKDAAMESAASAEAAKINAQESADAAKTSEDNAKSSETASEQYKASAALSAEEAETSETNAEASALEAKTSEENAAASEASTLQSANKAETNASNAAISEANAKSSENAAKSSQTNAATSANKAEVEANRAKTEADRAASIAQGQKGYFATPELLILSYPIGNDGDWAIVGTTDTIWVWDSDDGRWEDSGNKTDLSNYPTKNQVDEQLLNKISKVVDAKEYNIPFLLTDGSIGDSGYNSNQFLKNQKTASFVVGTSTAGYSALDVDYLCDGVDDQEEINAAIQALPENGGEVHLLDGTYNITAPILMNIDNVFLTGLGACTCILRNYETKNVKENLIYIPGNFCAVSWMNIDGNKDVIPGTSNCNIFVTGHNNLIINNIIQNTSWRGIYFNGSQSSRVLSNFLQGSITSIHLEGCREAIAAGNNCHPISTGIFVNRGCMETMVANNIISDGERGIFASGPTNYEHSRNCLICGNICKGNNIAGIDIGHANHHFNITGNVLAQNRIGILISNHSIFTDAILVSSNYCTRNLQSGISIEETASLHAILCNVCRENPTQSIEIGGGCTKNIVFGNVTDKAVTNAGGSTNKVVSNTVI